MEKETLLSIYLKDNIKYKKEIEKLIETDINDIINKPNKLTYEKAIIISEIFGMMPDELFYDQYKENKIINKKISEAKKLHTIIKNK